MRGEEERSRFLAPQKRPVRKKRASLGIAIITLCSHRADSVLTARAFQKDEIKNMQERLQKIIARAGIASRRHAELLILSGQVRVNGHVVKELGSKADAAKDRIEASGGGGGGKGGGGGCILPYQTAGVGAGVGAPAGRKTLRNCLRGLPERVFPVGNLEYAAS